MACPFCVQAGMMAANYEVGQLAKHIAKRHPVEGLAALVIGTVLIGYFGPKVARAITL